MHRQRLLVGELHPPTSVPNQVRRAASRLTGATHNATFGVCRLGCPSFRCHFITQRRLRVSARSGALRDWSGAARRLRAQGSAGQRRSNVVGTPLIVGTPVWVVGHEAMLCGVESGADGLEGVGRGVSVMVGADAFGLRATDGGLKPPPPSSVEPSGIPTTPTDDPGPIDEASGGDAVADAAQAPGALAAIPPPSKGAVPDVPVTDPPMPADAPVTGLPMSADVPVSELPMTADGGADETPLHVAPSMGDAPDVVGLTPGVASSVAPRGIPVCPTGAFGMPSGDVMPSDGRGEVLVRACA